MWRLVSLLNIVAMVGLPCFSESPKKVNQSNRADNAGLKLNITIENTKACSGDTEVYSNLLLLNARYTNDTDVPKAIFLQSGVPTQVLVARTEEDLKEQRYEVKNNLHVYPANGGAFLLGSNPQGDHATTIQPGQSVNARSRTAIAVRRVASSRISGTVAAGEHVLQIGMLLKISIPTTSRKQLSRARTAKYRWISVLSDSVPLTIHKAPELQDCSTQK
jgi:hypothetical protein